MLISTSFLFMLEIFKTLKKKTPTNSTTQDTQYLWALHGARYGNLTRLYCSETSASQPSLRKRATWTSHKDAGFLTSPRWCRHCWSWRSKVRDGLKAREPKEGPESQRKGPRALPGSAPSSPSARGTLSPAPPTTAQMPRGGRGREGRAGPHWTSPAGRAPRSRLSLPYLP